MMDWMKLRLSTTFIPRYWTGALRVLPDFLIIGVMKGGTTSLYDYLNQHPSIYPAFHKEIHYFSGLYASGETWYRAHFKTRFYKNYVLRRLKKDFLTGEATPGYLTNCFAAERAAKLVPQAKIIALLRNPVDRAYSHYYHNIRTGKPETLSFEEAIEKDAERWAREKQGMHESTRRVLSQYSAYAYLERGLYAERLKSWFDHYPKDQILILKSEDLYTDPRSVVDQTFRFLGVAPHELKKYSKFNEGVYGAPLKPELRKRLGEYFAPHNRKLYALVGRDFGWEKMNGI